MFDAKPWGNHVDRVQGQQAETSLWRPEFRSRLLADRGRPLSRDALEQPDVAVINAAEAANGDASAVSSLTKQQLQLATQARGLREEASKAEAFKAESREATAELQQVRIQLSTAALENSTAMEEMRAFQAAELHSLQAECAQVVAERDFIRTRADMQQANLDQTMQCNRDEVASMLQSIERERTTATALTCELQVASEQARRAEQAQYNTQLEGLQELEAYRTLAAQEKAMNMVEMQALLQHLADRQASIDDLSRERMEALAEVSRIEAESAQVQAESAQEKSTKRAKIKRSIEAERHEMASLKMSMEAERAKHIRLAEELQSSLEKVDRAEQEHRVMHARREEALQEREANEAEKYAEMQDFVLQLAARQQAIDDLSRERNATMEQAFQIEAASACMTARTSEVQRSASKQQNRLTQGAESDRVKADQAPLARELHSALERVQLSRERETKAGGQRELSSGSAQDKVLLLAKRCQEKVLFLAKRVEAAPDKSLEGERAAALEQVSRLEVKCAQATAERDIARGELVAQEFQAAAERDAIQYEFSEEQRRRKNQVESIRDEAASLAKDLAAEKAARTSLAEKLDAAVRETSRVQRDRDTACAEREEELRIQGTLKEDRAAALERASQAEAKYAQALAERDRIKQEAEQQQSKTTSASESRLDDVTVASLSKRLEAEKVAKAALVQKLDEALEQTFQVEQERDKLLAKKDEVWKKYENDPAKATQEREANVAQVQAQVQPMIGLQSTKESLGKERATLLEQASKEKQSLKREIAEQQSTMISLVQRLEEQKPKGKQTDEADGVQIPASVQRGLEENRMEIAESESPLQKKEVKGLMFRVEEEKASRDTFSRELQRKLSAETLSKEFESKLSADSKRDQPEDEPMRASTFYSALSKDTSSQPQSRNESGSPIKAIGSQDASGPVEQVPEPGSKFQNLLQALNNPPSPGASQSPIKATGSQSDTQSPSKDESTQGDGQPGKLSQLALKALSQTPSRSTSHSPMKGDSKSPSKDSQADSPSGTTFQSALQLLRQGSSQQPKSQDLSKGTSGQGDQQSTSTLQVGTTKSGTPPRIRSDLISWTRKDLQSAQPPPSSKEFGQGDSRTPPRAPSMGLGTASGLQARSTGQEDASNGSSLRGLAQTKANLQNLHERLKASAWTPQKQEEATREPVNSKNSETPTISDDRRSRKVQLDKSASRSGTAEKAGEDATQPRPRPPLLALEGLRKDLSTGLLINTGSVATDTPSTPDDSARKDAAKEQQLGEQRSASVPDPRAQVGLGLSKDSSNSGSRSWLDAAPGCRSLLGSEPSSRSATPSTTSSFKSKLASITIQAPQPRAEVPRPVGMSSAAPATTTTALGSRHGTPTRSGVSVRPGSALSLSQNASSPTTGNSLLAPGMLGVAPLRSGSNPRSALLDSTSAARTITPMRSSGTPPVPGRIVAAANVTPQESRPGLPLRLGSVSAAGGLRSSSASGVFNTASGGSDSGNIRNRGLQSSSGPAYAFGSSAVRSQD